MIKCNLLVFGYALSCLNGKAIYIRIGAYLGSVFTIELLLQKF